MSKQSLNSLEKSFRKNIHSAALKHAHRNYLLLFLIGVVSGPFMCTSSLFVPLVGFVFSCILVVQTCAYCFAQRSPLLGICWASGALLSVLGLSQLFGLFFDYMTIVFYALVAFSMAVIITLNVIMAGLIWSFYERGTHMLKREEREPSEKPNVLCITTMFPNRNLPRFGIFVLRRLKAASNHANITIVNPVPYFPGATRLQRYKYREGIPYEETLEDGTKVLHPHYLSIPGILKPLDGLFMYLSLKRYCSPDIDVVDAQLAFPDGWVGILLARWMKVPCVVTLRGHDINVLPSLPVRGRLVRWVLKNADQVMAVADALRKEAVKLGLPEERSQTIPNGVDTSIFRMVERTQAKETLKLKKDTSYILSVGHLIERKGHQLIVEALGKLKSHTHPVELLIIGATSIEGNYIDSLNLAIEKAGMKSRVTLVGEKPQEELHLWYSAADVFCLASSKEGWANVLLEALACGCPVVGTKVWGTPEVIGTEQGVLVERTSDNIAAGLEEVLEKTWNQAALRNYAQSFSWEEAGEKLAKNYELVRQSQQNQDEIPVKNMEKVLT